MKDSSKLVRSVGGHARISCIESSDLTGMFLVFYMPYFLSIGSPWLYSYRCCESTSVLTC